MAGRNGFRIYSSGLRLWGLGLGFRGFRLGAAPAQHQLEENFNMHS